MKDPVYGYIELDERVCDEIIDTPGFQRLRRVVQTSYAPLYPSALHNRFVHSLGVYYLGCYAANVLDGSVRRLFIEDSQKDVLEHWKSSLESFKLACLLHDFGHAPFSHTGEQFFDPWQDYLKGELVKRVGNEGFREDAEISKPAAPHEIMSAMLGIDTFRNKIPNVDLFARAITGYQYSDANNDKRQLDNILIEMLNSSTIDVDKLDYLIRDSYVVGFDSVHIDYERLLDGLRVVRVARSYRLAYHKSALSVLENVVYARDSEKKWIQSHPAVLYDQMLVQHACQAADVIFRGEKSRMGLGSDGTRVIKPSLFSEEALGSPGVENSKGLHVRWVADEDVLYLAKNKCENDALVNEYFSRNARRHPLWKSEAEYRATFNARDPNLEDLTDMLASIAKWAQDNGLPPLLNDELISEMREDEQKRSASTKSNISNSAASLGQQIGFLEGLRDVCKGALIEGVEGQTYQPAFDFALIGTSGFISGFRGGSFAKINILFPVGNVSVVRHFSDVSNTITYSDSELKFFHLYHHDAGKAGFPRKEIIEYLREGWLQITC